MAAWLAIIVPFVKPVLVPIFSALVGWLIPSPLQRAAKVPVEVKNAEEKGDAGDPSQLDRP